MTQFLQVAVAAMALTASQAQAACWAPQHVAAAKVRDLDTMMMVAALRCRTTNLNVMDRYNAFVTMHRKTLTQINDTLRDHYRSAGSARAVLDAYDGYVTKVANRYGAGTSDVDCAGMVSIADAAIAEASTVPALQALAERAGVQPLLDAETCPVTVVAVAGTGRD